jgi:hypothetical protein
MLMSLQVRGQLLSVGIDQPPFLELSQTLWSASTGHPSDTATGPSHGHTQRLYGNYSWLFSIPLPARVPVTDGQGHPTTVPLPPSFAPKGVPSFIDYKVQVLVRRGSLRVDST